jgi:hypothetical protein
MKSLRGFLFTLMIAASVSTTFAQQADGSLRGQIKDAFDALIVGATVKLVDSGGREKTAVTDAQGVYLFNDVAPGTYTVNASASGFAVYEKTDVVIAAGRRTTLDIPLTVTLEQEEVTVSPEGRLSTDSENNANAIVLRGRDLETLPEDPDDLVASLQAMAGPSAGPNGGQVFVDGFTGGRLPPKSSIREVRVSNNPFNAENDQPGFGRIDILTRPGLDKFHGSASFNFNDESLNSRNPFAPRRIDFQTRLYGLTLSGPVIAKKASFFVDFQKREEDDNEIINATILDPATLQVEGLRLSALSPRRFTNFSPRFDYAFNPNNTLIARYTYTRTTTDNTGIGSFSLLSQAFNIANTDHNVQITETAVLGATAINETRFQYLHRRREQEGDTTSPAIAVLEAFTGGGTQVGLASNNENRWDIENYTTLTRGFHVLRFGARLRHVRLDDFSPQNFGGTFIFAGGVAPRLDPNNEPVRDSNGQVVNEVITSIERFRRTVLFQRLGFTPARLRELGGGATQFSISGGNPEAKVNQTDLSAYVQDEWKLRPNFTMTLGLRYETQSNIDSNFNFGPRFFIAWAPGATSTGTSAGSGPAQPKTVIRFGTGIFYERFNENGTLQANRFNGVNQLRFNITDPAIIDTAVFNADSVSNAPAVADLAGINSPQLITRVASNFRAPYTILYGLQIERQLPYKFTFFGLFTNFRTRHVLRLRNINAPLPGTFDPLNPDSAQRPIQNAGDIYQYESSGTYNDTRMLLGMRNQFRRDFTFFANYSTGVGKTDSECAFGILANCFPANSYDLSGEYGRISFLPRHRVIMGGTFILPALKLTLNPFVVASTGRFFNIVTGRDTNGDKLFMERPAFADSATAPQDLRSTPYGDFDINPKPGQTIIPRNFGEGPNFFSVNLNLSRTFGLGSAPRPAKTAAPAAAQGGGARPAGAGASGTTTAAAAGPRPAAPAPEQPYKLMLGVNILNIFNRANLNFPVGNLSSPFFGQSTTTVGGFGVGGNSAAGNRRIQFQVRFSF